MINPDDIKYRFIEPSDVDYAYELILRVFHKFVAPHYSGQGINTFLNMLSPEFLKVSTEEQFTIVACYNNIIIGIISIINKSHIALLFVDMEFQKKGLGKALIQQSMTECCKLNSDIKSLTVSSSPNSLSFYKRVGFKVVSEERNENGMRFIPMEMLFN